MNREKVIILSAARHFVKNKDIKFRSIAGVYKISPDTLGEMIGSPQWTEACRFWGDTGEDKPKGYEAWLLEKKEQAEKEELGMRGEAPTDLHVANEVWEQMLTDKGNGLFADAFTAIDHDTPDDQISPSKYRK